MTQAETISEAIARACRPGRPHLLDQHLREVARRAAQFASEFDSASWAEIAGLWHDLGKFSPEFQSVTRSLHGGAAHIETPLVRPDHSSAGAIHALEQFGPDGMALAYLIAGHHSGLPDWDGGEAMRCLSERLKKKELLKAVLSELPAEDIIRHPHPCEHGPGGTRTLWVRMLFSCLIDADLLDSEIFLEHDKAEGRSGYPPFTDLWLKFEADLRERHAAAAHDPESAAMEQAVRQSLEKSPLEPGLFSLTAPAGSVRDLASLAFAFAHAARHGKKRIFCVLPGSRAIEPMADRLRTLFGDAVVEYHTNLGPKHETPQSRLACENWDAPVVVTTAERLFETFFEAHPDLVRRLHSLVNAVVVLDGLSRVPRGLLRPVMRTIDDLARCYRTTFLFSSCVPCPWISGEHDPAGFPGLHGVREISDSRGQAGAPQRRPPKVELPREPSKPTAWEDLARRICGNERVLCIADRRDDCRHLYKLLPAGSFHFSELMCGEHRSEILAALKKALEGEGAVRVVATPMIEGVPGLGFPAVYRSLCGPESMFDAAQFCAAGNTGGCRLVGFAVPGGAPEGQDRALAALLDEKCPAGFLTPEALCEYFRRLYRETGTDWDPMKLVKDLEPEEKWQIRFNSASKKYRLAAGCDQSPVIVLFGKSPLFIARLRKFGPERWLMRKLQRYVVRLPRRIHQKLLTDGSISEVHPGLYVQAHEEMYHSELGFLPFEDVGTDPHSAMP